MSMIDVTICLSLKHRTDRRHALQREYPAWLPPIEWHDALTPQDCIVPGSWGQLPSYYSTTLGHLQILEKLWLRDDWTTALILEDDALFLPYSAHLLEFIRELDVVRPDWLAAFLGWHMQKCGHYVSARVQLNTGSTQSHAYVVRRHGLWRLYDHLWCSRHDIVDWAYCYLMETDHAFFIPDKQMITTRAGYSDNLFANKAQGT